MISYIAERKRLSSRAGGSRYSTNISHYRGLNDLATIVIINCVYLSGNLVFLIRIKALLKPTIIIETDFSSPHIKNRTQSPEETIRIRYTNEKYSD